ncbi:MAG: hypothetical protein JAY96_11335 [Candidatus Thiodiazotropha endolucinida]|nr:hypothetical protein [Candidatus Thiodiazotropha taylori]MCG7882167.1 hypothetical protein [Candidatus Thiodiazotropha taylori]MCG8101734.1 hypothetical protein [Candidatus Thiodiazotropha taylori]MCG8122236.1 hypothetical protein [Candidatus Thiodiazotropha taylori]
MRESLGLTAQWLADQAGVKLRSVQYWESGRSPVPEDVAGMINQIEASINYAVGQAVEIINAAKKKQGCYPELVALVRYRTDEDLWRFRGDMRPLPATAHAELLARLTRELSKMGVEFRIVYMEVATYIEWLGNRSDNESTRAEWASQQV